MYQINLSKARIMSDDAKCREFLAKAGCLSGLVPDPPFDTISATFANEEGYVYASYCNRPDDPGYAVVIFPADKYSLEEAAICIAVLREANRVPGTPSKDYEVAAECIAGGN
jgi:hypothetical protein